MQLPIALNGCRKIWMRIQKIIAGGRFSIIRNISSVFQDLQRERSWVDQKFTVERPALSFITQDEIDAVLRRGGTLPEDGIGSMSISWNITI